MVAIVLYIPLALWLICSITVQTIKRDWLYGSLMLFPVPIITGWLLAVGLEGRFYEQSIQHIHDFTPWIGLSFLSLAITVALFIYFRQRWLKVAVLILSGLLTLAMVAYQADGRLRLVIFLALIFVLLGLFLTPALLDRKIRDRTSATAEDKSY